MHVLILGGDGYLGWPAAMYFSKRGHEVTVADNYFRRNACTELDLGMLYNIPNLVERSKIWKSITGLDINVKIGDLTDAEFLRSLFVEVKNENGSKIFKNKQFDTVLHLAEQPSAPYSLLSYKHANKTLQNNLIITNNLMFAVKDLCPETHIIHIGTMGEYGTPNIDIEEGWLEIEHKGRKDKFLFPRQASSIYHTSKIMDTDLMWFGIRTWGLRMTDLMQGPVYGIDTEETELDTRLRPIFNYDEIFGTVLNRFIVQAICGYPLTIYGKGGQTRGYLNIKDAMQCIYFAATEPAQRGELRIFNQIMETFSVTELATITQRVGNKLGHNVKTQHIANPRKESEEHYYNPKYQGLLDLGVIPHYLTDDVMESFFQVAAEYQENIRKDVIFRGVKW